MFSLQSGLGSLVSKEILNTNKTGIKHTHTVCHPERVLRKECLQYNSHISKVQKIRDAFSMTNCVVTTC